MATDRQSAHLKARFLLAFAESGNVSSAARTAGVGRSTVYVWQEHDERFLHAYREAEVQAVDALEGEARRRALGYDVKTFDAEGNEHTVTKYSDVLLIFLLKGARPEKYRERLDITATPQVVKAYAGFDPSEV